MANQGWDRADYSCGSCGHTFTAATEHEYIGYFTAHAQAHEIVDALSSSPQLLDHVKQLLAMLST